MRIKMINTICIMTLSAILFTGLAASAQDSNMEASAGCADTSCMFHGLAQNENAAQLKHINLFSADGKDPRSSADRAAEVARAFMPVGMIENNTPVPTPDGQSGKGKATAFMVSPCFALTNHHVPFGADKNPNPSVDHSLTMHLGAGENGGFRYAIKTTPVVWGTDRTSGNDWALVQLEKCAGKKTGWMELEVLDFRRVANTEVSMAGYPSDRSNDKITFQTGCHIRSAHLATDSYSHDCSSVPGASGSPIFKMVNGKPVVVGIHAASRSSVDGVLTSYSEENSNVAVPLDFLRSHPEVKAIIDEDIRSFGQPNPAETQPSPAPTTGTSARA